VQCLNYWRYIETGFIYCGLHVRGIWVLVEGGFCKENTTIWRLEQTAFVPNSMKACAHEFWGTLLGTGPSSVFGTSCLQTGLSRVTKRHVPAWAVDRLLDVYPVVGHFADRSLWLIIARHSFISIQPLGRFSRNQSLVRRPVWLWHAAS